MDKRQAPPDRRIFAAAFVAVFVAFIVFMSRANAVKTSSQPGGPREKSPSYSIVLPQGWKTTFTRSGGSTFTNHSATAGGVELLGNPGPNGVRSLLPNHAEVTGAAQARFSAGTAVVFDLHRTQPAADGSSQKDTWYETHVIFPGGKIPLDLWVVAASKAGRAEAHQTAMVIAGSLRWKRMKSAGTITAVSVISSQVRPDGALWGGFDVAVQIEDNGSERPDNFRIQVTHIITKPNYPNSAPKLITKTAPVPRITPKGNATVLVRGFRVDHPELTQEILVTIPGTNEVMKLVLSTSFPPGSND